MSRIFLFVFNDKYFEDIFRRKNSLEFINIKILCLFIFFDFLAVTYGRDFYTNEQKSILAWFHYHMLMRYVLCND
jgi:hypothetical protein